MVGGRDGKGGGRRGSQGGKGRDPGGTGKRNQGGGRRRGSSSSQNTESGRDRGSRGGQTGGRSKGPSLPPNPSSMQFIRALKNCPTNRLKQQIEQLEKSWLRCWQDVDHLHFDAVKTLLSALARLPFSVSIAPPPLSCISQAVSTLLSQIVRKGGDDEDFDGNDDTLEGVELVERVVTRLLKFTWGVKRGEVKDALDGMITKADGSLNALLKTHRPVRSRLMALLSEIEKPWSIKVKTREETEADGELVMQDWRHPSVAWLADFKNFQPALLPKLQLRNSNEGRVYDSSDEYFTTIVKLWIGMTFVEGNNALLPRCTVKVADKVCDQPLWPFPGKQSSINCKNSQCRRNSTFVCANRQHFKGLCDECAGEYQKRLRGPPSKYSSTHIYDGSIAHVKYDGTMTIEQVASRKPPLNPIHWKTTKRLSSPNLIGIVRLPSREASLQTCDEVYWAEIIFQGKSFDEYKAREHGRLSLRLLQYLDEPGNAMLTHNPAVGDAVAIIDCQTFVPEFVPVLKALEMQRQMPVPFQEGALLNLSEHNNFSSRPEPDEVDHRFENDSDYAYDSDYDDEDMYSTTDISRLSTRELIRKVIELSLLDPIVDIRRDGRLRNELETKLLQLVNSATLDPGQLRSFTESLMYPVHCTQGPPGTGKSYLGVVVVRALLIIRDLWKRKNRDVGDPPILVLSYKNHAIDEFLLDLLRSEPTLDHGPRRRQSFAKYYVNNGFKKLIRIGGTCNEPELEPYRERNATFSDPRVRKASKRIEECQGLRDQWLKFRDCISPIFEAQATVAGGTKSLTSNEWKIVQSAVPVAASAVATLQKLSDIDGDKSLKANTEEKSATDSASAVAEAEAESPLQAVTIVLTKKLSLTNSDIAQLYEGIKHYDPAIDSLEVLYRWMSGFCPLPACSYSESCSKVCCDKSRFCEEHSCKFTSDGEQYCLGEVALKHSFCQEHLCTAEECKRCRVTVGQAYCEDHGCFICLVRNEPAELATDEPPRNTCERHPLCWALDGMCPEVAEVDKSYCKAHIEELFCKWKSVEGGSCEEIATAGQYCGSHHAEMLAEAARAAQKSTGKCEALTKKGKPCKGKPLPGSNFCANHADRNHLPAAQTPDLTLPKFEVQDEANKSVDQEEATDSPQNDQPPQLDLDPSSIKEPEKGEADAQDDDVWSLDSDVEGFEEAAQYDNEDEVEESEHLQHMRDVYEVGDDEIDDEPEVEEDIEDEEKAPWAAPDQQLVRSSEWHWDMTLEQRWNALFSVLDLWKDVNSSLQKAFGNHIGDLKTELQREILRANSRVYEGKSVIGGTITGCVARLEAIRTTNPFAILVEEASEVMEPLLVSCFSSSTRKLEMIGDHMQLQPSVMGRIDFERVNKINISMFERLISAPHGNEVPSSVLSIQRRMRKSICDLTRNFYGDITEIVDHAVCGTKVIGGTKRKPGALPLLDACEGGGREVPGLLPHIFFWSHSGRQERASVGLSRVNKQEADMACKLVKYLTQCGVPANSIAVLTPYKGQLMLMRKILMNTHGLTMMPKGGGSLSPSCTVSTVDRFQGDEADVVIISLVIDGKSRTQFVKLQNRMIVALSRARLGMYVVGNVDYFGEATPHWQKTLGLLRKDAEPDNFKPIGCATYAGAQIGPSLPICCPQHRTSYALAKGERDLQLGFCKVVCSVKLVCSHGCGLNCHWPNVDMHNKKCNEGVGSPCSRHPRVLKCSSVTGSQRISITEALKKYQCDVQVAVSLRCGHSQKMTCFSHTEIEARRKPWPVCNKQAITPYVYPKCKHLLTCTCSEFDRYSMGLAPPCTEQVEHTPPCQHTVTLACHDRRNYTAKARTFVCKEKVTVMLPRCGHDTVASCIIAENLKKWSGESCATPNLVKEGELYGPKDYSCKRSVKFQRLCGHHETVRCERAFELAQNPSRCQEPVVVSNPECGHDCSTTCYEAKQLSGKVGRTFWGIIRGKPFDPLDTVHQGNPRNYLNMGLGLQCNEEVTYVRICGHKQKLTCSEARHATSVCEEQVVKELPICGHTVRLPCHLSASLKEWQPWQVQSPQIQLVHEDDVVEDTLPVPGSPPTALRSILKACTAPVRFRRTSTCGHDLEVKCCEAFKFLTGKETPGTCEVQVQKQLDCGHEISMKCSDDVDSVVCQESVEKRCWNFATCGSGVAVPCTVAANIVQCAAETEWLCSEGHSFSLRLCSRGLPSDCPSCSTARLDTEIKSIESILSDKKLDLWAPEAARFLPEMTGVTHITMSLGSKRDFLIRKLKLLVRFKDGLTGTEWGNPLFFPVEIPVFVELSRKLQNQDIDSFEMKDFGSVQNFNGIEVYEATQENLKRLANGGKAVVLFGFLYTAKYLTNPIDIPKNKGKKNSKVPDWVTRQVSHGYDALYRDTQTGKKGGSWIAWQPQVLFPVHRVEITDTNRDDIVKFLPEKTQVHQQDLKISFKTAVGATNFEGESTPVPSFVSEETIDRLRLLCASVSPVYEKLNVWYPWDGKTFSTGASEVIPQKMEKTLASKLSFVPKQFAGSTQQSKTPFGGIKYLQNLQSQEKLKEDGDLFLALELLAVRKLDTSETRLKLEEYVTRVCQDEAGYAHPLVIVAIARLAARVSKTQSSGVQRKLLKLFTSLYPEASEIWLDATEATSIKTVTSQTNVDDTIVSGSSVKDKWESIKTQYGCRSEAMEELLRLVGLKKVKQAAVNLFKAAMALQKMSPVEREKNSMPYNYCFFGNPGTGKTTVARLFAKVLKDSKIRPTNTFVECTVQELKDEGANGFRSKVKQATGGVLFIDEAYELDPKDDPKGKPIVAELLTASENKRDEISIILAGYEEDIHKKLYAYNDGLKSRFEEVMFEDFDAQDLEVIWDGMAKDRGWKYEKAIAKVAMRRLAKSAGRKGFGNARAVRKLFDRAAKEAMAREDFDGELKFQTVDLLGERPSTNPKLATVLKEVEEKTGWGKIKEEMKNLVRISDENYDRELKGHEPVEIFYNRLFLGNPGTGKTTCAQYYGRLLKALNFLSNGEVVKKTAGDFIGMYIGESKTKTVQILDMAQGKVLVIDEAYNLNDDQYGKQVLDVLVEKVQGTENDDLAVLLIGYENEMLEMLRTQNPGLMRRFPPQYAFHFEDYTDHELLEILERNCTKRSVTCPYEVAGALLKQLALQKTQPNFGNAGAVEQLLKSAMGKAMNRPMVDGMTVLTLEDIDGEGGSEEDKDPIKLLDKLYRMEEIKEQLIQLRNEMVVADNEGSSLPKVGHFVFRGSPGTGKTTVARVMAEILHGMGVLATTKLVETSGLELTGEYLGQTKKKVNEKLGEAKGGLMFIDEAYELGEGKFGREAMTTLVAAMTNPSYVGLVIIIAGYPKDMDQMLDRNVGLKSRFTKFIDFPDWEAQDAVEFVSGKAETENFEVESEAVLSLQKTFVELKKLANFGNGRDAVRVWEELQRCRSQRVVKEPELERTITEDDAEKAGQAVIVARRGGGVPGKGVPTDEDPMKLLDELYRMDQIRAQLTRLKTEMIVAEREGSKRPEIGHFVFRGSPGTGKTTVARVMAQILYAMGALATTKLVETSGLDLTGEYLGQTKKKVTDKLVEAKGGLLFIDEAYELGKGHFGEEAMTTLVAAMTDPVYAGMVIVIAGYPHEMDTMLRRNSGLKSRFTRYIDFSDWEAEDGVAFLKVKAEKEEIQLESGVEKLLLRTFTALKKLDGFGNGRDAVQLWNELLQSRAQRVYNSKEDLRTITKSDTAMAGKIILDARRPPAGANPAQSSTPSDTPMFMTQEQQPSARKESIQILEEEDLPLDESEEKKEKLEEKESVKEESKAEKEEDVEEENVDKKVDEVRDPGVSDEVWEELERAKEAHAAHLESLKRAKEEHAAHLRAMKHAREQKKIEEERRRAAAIQEKMEEEKRRAAAIQEKIRRICPCPAGYNWYRYGGGWRCGGGSHFVSDAQLNSHFTR